MGFNEANSDPHIAFNPLSIQRLECVLLRQTDLHGTQRRQLRQGGMGEPVRSEGSRESVPPIPEAFRGFRNHLFHREISVHEGIDEFATGCPAVLGIPGCTCGTPSP